MLVKHILDRKGHEVLTAGTNISLSEAARTLKAYGIGALVILDEAGRVAGIVSERDIVHAIADFGLAALERTVAEIMTRDVRTCSLEDPIERLMEVMTERRVRHLPVVEEGRLLGIVSIGDVVKQRMDEIAFEAEQMKMYITS